MSISQLNVDIFICTLYYYLLSYLFTEFRLQFTNYIILDIYSLHVKQNYVTDGFGDYVWKSCCDEFKYKIYFINFVGTFKNFRKLK